MCIIIILINIRFVWGALAEDNGNHLDPGDRGILRWWCKGWGHLFLSIWSHLWSNWFEWKYQWFDWYFPGWTLCSIWEAETANHGCSSFAMPSKRFLTMMMTMSIIVMIIMTMIMRMMIMVTMILTDLVSGSFLQAQQRPATTLKLFSPHI